MFLSFHVLLPLVSPWWQSALRGTRCRTPRTSNGVCNIMTSSNGNIVRVTGPLCGKFTGHRWIPLTKASDAELSCFSISPWINGWVNYREACDLRRHRANYDVIVMNTTNWKRGWLWEVRYLLFVMTVDMLTELEYVPTANIPYVRVIVGNTESEYRM